MIPLSSSTVTVLVSFYLAATDGTSETTAIHKEKFNVLINPDKRKDLVNIFTGLVEIAKSKGLGENPRPRLPDFKKQAVALRFFHSGLKMPGNMNLTL